MILLKVTISGGGYEIFFNPTKIKFCLQALSVHEKRVARAVTVR